MFEARVVALAGMIEYWAAESHQFPGEAVSFNYKMETDLFALAKGKTQAASLAVSSDGSQFAIFSTDRSTPSAVHAQILVAL